MDAVVANPRTVYLFVGRDLPRGVAGRLRHLRRRRPRPGPQHRGRPRAGRRRAGHRRPHVPVLRRPVRALLRRRPRRRRRRLPADVAAVARRGARSSARCPRSSATASTPRSAARTARRTCSRGAQFVRAGGDRPEPIAGTWGRVRNAFTADGGDRVVDAAFVARDGELYAFRGDQYVRYRPGETATRRRGLPALDQGRLGGPAGRLRGGHRRRVRLRGPHLPVLRRPVRALLRRLPRRSTAPTRSRSGHRWRRRGRLPARRPAHHRPVRRSSPTRTRARRRPRGVPRAPGPVAATRTPGSPSCSAGTPTRSAGSSAAAGSSRATAEATTTGSTSSSSCRMHDLFRAGRTGWEPGRHGVHDDVWQRCSTGRPPAPDGAAAAAPGAAARAARRRRTSGRRCRAGSTTSSTSRTRDALVAAVLAKDPADGLRTSRDLFDRFLIDVDMGEGRTVAGARGDRGRPAVRPPLPARPGARPRPTASRGRGPGRASAAGGTG